jgi:two-component system, response regulator RegA
MTSPRVVPPGNDQPSPSILVVDDDEPFRRRLARALAARGYEIRDAPDYDSALAAARAESPELAVVDLKMPGRSGLELARDLHAVDPATRILILTGYASVTTAVEAMRLGAAWYLPKPADADDILLAFARAEGPPLAQVDAEIPVPTLERAKWEHLQRILSDCAGNVSEAARRLGMHRRSLQRMLQRNPPRQ